MNEKIETLEELEEILKPFGEYFWSKIIEYETNDRKDIAKEIYEKYFVNWWNQWIDEKITSLDENWYNKRAAYIMLQIAFLVLKKRDAEINDIKNYEKSLELATSASDNSPEQ